MLENQSQGEMKSNNHFELKYTKAIKEISKLVSLNTATKKEMNHFKKLYEEESKQNISLKQMISELQQSYANGYPSERSIGSPNSCKKYMSNTPIQEADKELEQTGTLSDFPDFQKKLNACEEKILHQQSLICSLNQQIENKNRECLKLGEELLLMKNEKQRQVEMKKQCINNHENDQKVLKECLYKSQEEVYELTKKINILQDRLASVEGQKSLFSKTGELEYLRDKTAELTFENKKLLRKLREKKQKYFLELQELRNQNNSFKASIQKLTVFMGRQQEYIENFCLGSIPQY